ncbi:MAG: hypothetical protein Q9162_004967 [Coniocarpon cinnabarinum]
MIPNSHDDYMNLCLELASKSPPKPSNYRVGAVLVAEATNTILSTGYTLELPGNTHAEQCALSKYAEQHGIPEERVGEALMGDLSTVIYTSMEPCIERLSGNLPCIDRIIRTREVNHNGGIRKVYTGVKEPDTFVQKNEGKAKLEAAGIEVTHVSGFEQRTLEVATAGHEKEETPQLKG